MPITVFIYGLPGVGKSKMKNLLTKDESFEPGFEVISEFVCRIVKPGELKKKIIQSNLHLEPSFGKSKDVQHVGDAIRDASLPSGEIDTVITIETSDPNKERAVPLQPTSPVTQNACILVIISKDRITEDIHKITNEEIKILSSPINPVVLLISGCDSTADESWWEKNKNEFKKYGLSFNTVILGSLKDPRLLIEKERENFTKKRKETKKAVEEAIKKTANILLAEIIDDENNLVQSFFAFFKFLYSFVSYYTLACLGRGGNSIKDQAPLPSIKDGKSDGDMEV